MTVISVVQLYLNLKSSKEQPVTGYNIYVNGSLFSAEPSYITGIKVNLLESDTWYNITVRAKYDVDSNDVFSFDTGITEKTN